MRRRAALEADIAQASVQLDSSRGSGDRTAERQLRERIESDRASLDAQREHVRELPGRPRGAGGLHLARDARPARHEGEPWGRAGHRHRASARRRGRRGARVRRGEPLRLLPDARRARGVGRLAGARGDPPRVSVRAGTRRSTADRRRRRRSGGCGPTSSSRCARTCRPCWSRAPIPARARPRSSRIWAGAWRSPAARWSSSTPISARRGCTSSSASWSRPAWVTSCRRARTRGCRARVAAPTGRLPRPACCGASPTRSAARAARCAARTSQPPSAMRATAAPSPAR